MNPIKIGLVWRLHGPDWFYMKSLSNIIYKTVPAAQLRRYSSRKCNLSQLPRYNWENSQRNNFEFGVELGRALKFL